jgi:hypothetical protein
MEVRGSIVVILESAAKGSCQSVAQICVDSCTKNSFRIHVSARRLGIQGLVRDCGIVQNCAESLLDGTEIEALPVCNITNLACVIFAAKACGIVLVLALA